MHINKIIVILLFTLFSGTVFSAPVNWAFRLVDKGSGEIELQCNAQIQPGWHLYDTDIEEGGPYPTALNIEELAGATAVGEFKASGSKANRAFDKIFEMEVGYFDLNATFVQRFKITDKKAFSLKGDVRAQACNDRECTPPIPIDFSFDSSHLPSTLTINEPAKEKSIPKKEPVVEKPEKVDITPVQNQDSVMSIPPVSSFDSDTDTWAPVIDKLNNYGTENNISDESLLVIFGLGFLGGLVALVTPCVWPMIPMTVSFFLKRNKKSKAKAVREALIYGLGIIIIYVSLGLLITAIFGAGALNEMATSAFFNLLFFVLLIVFAASFFGAFELVLPSSWTNKMDAKADSTTGFVSIFFMAFTLALVSFSCTGPLIGTLLVEAAGSGSVLSPAIGMLGFAVALAIPFALFAVFPSMLESMPKSGGWLNSVKVVLGFLELALALKFLSVADLAYGWHILDREVFIVLWIIIFVLLGVYLLGKIKFAHDSDVKHVSVTRLFLAVFPLSFAIYMLPGLWGAPLKAISAFTPPMNTQDFSLYDGVVHARFDDYDEGMAYAQKNNMPVMVDFSGFACVNCRKMEASVWTDPRVKNILENDYVLITLMVDDKRALPAVVEVEENGKTTRLKTIGDKWSYLQRHKFGRISQPFYVTLDPRGEPIGPWHAYNEDIDEYIEFLQKGLTNFKKKQNE